MVIRTGPWTSERHVRDMAACRPNSPNAITTAAMGLPVAGSLARPTSLTDEQARRAEWNARRATTRAGRKGAPA